MTSRTSENASAAASNRKRRLIECFKRGMHLATCEKNYDYAHAMFAECVLHDPGNLEFVEALVQSLRARTPRAKRWRFRGGNRAIKKAVQHQDWATVLRIGIELLKDDPWDVTTLRTLAGACATLHYNDVELVYLKQALDAAPKNADVIRHCARSLARMGQFDQAIACWHRVETLRSKDDEAAKMISMLAEEKLKYPGGRPPVTRTREAPVAEPEPEEAPTDDVVLSAQQKLEQAIASDPRNAANYLELAKSLLGSSQFDAAETVLSKAIAACGDQQPLVELLERVRYLRAEEQRTLAEERAAERQIENTPVRIPWLELALGSALVILIFQLIPSTWTLTLRVFDVRNWSRLTWFVFNLIVLLVLLAIRFGPSWRAYAPRARRRRRASSGRL